MTVGKIKKGLDLMRQIKSIEETQSNLKVMIERLETNEYPPLQIQSGAYNNWAVLIPRTVVDDVLCIIEQELIQMLEEKQKEFDEL